MKDNSEEDKSPKDPMSAAQRQQKHRQRNRELADGASQPSLLDQAKQELADQIDLNLHQLLSQDKFKGQLSSAEIVKLQNWISNHRQKIRREEQENIRREQLQQNIMEKAQRFTNQLIPDLHRALLTPQTEKERAELIQQKIDDNLFLFLDYMENYEPPFQDFLRIVVDLHSKVNEPTFTKLFARVCAQHRGEEIRVTFEMVERGMEFLVESKTNNIAAFGFLRLIYQNNISLHLVKREKLREFEQIYYQTILNFFKSIPGIKPQVTDSLAPTLFAFTSPMLKTFREGGAILYSQVPPLFLPFIIDIICHSFTECSTSFENFLTTLKSGCLDHYELLISKSFTNVLQALSDETKEMNQLYFGSLTQHTIILERAFKLIKEKKILAFDKQQVEDLVRGGQDQFALMCSRPSVKKISDDEAVRSCLLKLVTNNDHFDICNFNPIHVINDEDMESFLCQGISRLLPLQQICFNICTNTWFRGRSFILYETGQGKTALCLAIAVKKVRQGFKVIIMNSSSDLTFRDHKKGSRISSHLGIQILRLAALQKEENDTPRIIYAEEEELRKMLLEKKLTGDENSCLIIDEFDSVIFEEHRDSQSLKSLVENFRHIIGFSGSELQEFQKKYLETAASSNVLNFLSKGGERCLPTQRSTLLSFSLNDFKDQVTSLALEQVHRTPVIIISDSHSDRFKKTLQAKGLTVENMGAMDPPSVESSLAIFCKTHNAKYAVFLINSYQGRGIDFPTNSDIEQNGGVFVMITELPRYFLQFRQFIGRTCRIGNKGAYQVVLLDKDAKNCDGEAYLVKKLEELKNNEFNKHAISDEMIISQRSFSPAKSQQIESDGIKDDPILIETSSSKGLEIPQSSIQNQEELKDSEIQDQIQIQQKVQSPKQKANEQSIGAQTQDGKKRDAKQEQKRKERTQRQKTAEVHQMSQADENYFQNYGELEIHKEMLSDEARVDNYRAALNALSFEKSVVDVGAGTGLLSLMAMDAGAKCVYAIEQASIAEEAQTAFSRRKDKNRMMLFRGMAEEFSLGRTRVDLLVSEWMGYFLIFEHMLPSVIAVRNSCLKNGGEIIPSKAELFIAGYADSAMQSFQEIDRSSETEIEDAVIELCSDLNVCTTRSSILDLDLLTTDFISNSFNSKVSLRSIKDGSIQGIVAWFTCNLSPGIILDTSPFSKSTHWKQTMFPFGCQLSCQKDDIFSVEVDAKQLPDNHRGLQINLIVTDKSLRQLFKRSYKIE